MNWENQSMFTPMTLDKTIEQYNSTKQRLNTERGQQMTSQRFANMENNLSLSINSDDENIKKQGNLASRTWLVAQMISEEASKHWKDFSTMTDWEILDTYKKKNPQRAWIIDWFINSDQDPYELKKAMWWSNTPAVEVDKEPEKTFMDKAKTSVVWPFARAISALWEWIYWVGKWIANIPNRADEFNQRQVDRGYIDQVWPEWKNLDTNLYQKIKWFGRLAWTLWQVVWDVAWWGLMWIAEWLSTNQEKEAVKDAVADVAAAVINSEPWEKVQEMYNSLSDEQKQELWDWFSVLDWLSDIPLSIWWWAVAKQAIKQWAKWLETQVVKQWVKQLDNAIDTAETAAKNYQVNKAVKNLEKNTAEAEATAGRIVQWDIKAQKEAVNALKSVDTKDVKTYKDLWNKIDEKATEIAKKVDEELSKYNDKYSGTTSRVEEIADWVKEPIEYTPAQDVIDDLTKLYTKLWDKKWLAEMWYWEWKLNAEWLTLKELNDLAKKHWVEFRRKAFNEDWSWKYSDIWEKYETNRQSMKEYIRELLPDDTTKNLDIAYHELMDTNYYVNKMSEKVNALTQKIKKRNIIEKLWAKAGDIVNMLSWWWIKAFVTKFIPSNVWNKINNSLDMEAELPKLLSKLDDLNRKIDLAQTPQEVEEVAKIVEDTFK